MNLQTSWQLELCFKRLETDPQSTENLSPPLNPSLGSHAPCPKDLGTCDNVNVTDNAAEIAAISPAVTEAFASNNGFAAGTAPDAPEPIDNAQHSLSSHPDHSDSSPQSTEQSCTVNTVTSEAPGNADVHSSSFLAQQ